MYFLQKFTRILEKKLLATLANIFLISNFYNLDDAAKLHTCALKNSFGTKNDNFSTFFDHFYWENFVWLQPALAAEQILLLSRRRRLSVGSWL